MRKLRREGSAGKSAEAIGNFEDNAEDVRSAEAEMRESFSGECPPASDVEITASADDPNDKKAFAAQNVSGNAEALPNGESAAPYKDAPAASYTAPSGSFSYTASVSAGAPDAPGSGNGARSLCTSRIYRSCAESLYEGGKPPHGKARRAQSGCGLAVISYRGDRIHACFPVHCMSAVYTGHGRRCLQTPPTFRRCSTASKYPST